MNPSVQRKRLACAECTRRKIKCDKVLPCRNCTRRGSACHRNEQQHRRGPLKSVPGHTESADPADPTLLADNLTACIRDLQETLQAVRKPPSSACDFQDSAVSVAADTLGDTASATPAPSEGDCRSRQNGTYSSPESIGAEDAATILEFLAWGRRKVSSYDDGVDSDPNNRTSPFSGDIALDQDSATDPEASRLCLSDQSSLELLQLLLPQKKTIVAIVKYHCECLLWYHGSFHGLVFYKELELFLNNHQGRIDHPGVDLQWVALLFAVFATSMTCAPRSVARSWGFEMQERAAMAQRCFKAGLICLNRANYTAYHSIYAVQCITTMTMSAHMLGHSNSHSVMLATATRISQSLGFHRLGSPSEDHPLNTIKRETGRRVWTELCIQDWFSIPFSESYLIHQLDFNTEKPRNCMDEDMLSTPDEVPTIMTYHRFLYDIALLMPQMHDDISRSNTTYAKYEHVLRYDTRMRTIASKHIPPCLKSVALEPSWPRYVPWARHCLTISSAHKIIMIHRKFLWQSFTNPAFSFTRKTCIAASKTIIRAQKQAAKDDGPDLWIYHAFSVAASIILCLDLRFRSPSGSEYREHRALIRDTVSILGQSQISMIAKRGVRIIRLLLQLEQERIQQPPAPPIRPYSQSEVPGITDGDDTSFRYDRVGDHCDTSMDWGRLSFDIHRLVSQVFSGKEMSGQRSSANFRENLYQQNAAGQCQGSTSTPNLALQDSNNDIEWPWPDSAQDEHDPGRYSEDAAMGNYSGVQPRFVMSDSLEDILLLAQNGGRG